MHQIGMFNRQGSLELEGFHGSGADFLEDFKQLILDGKTIIASPQGLRAGNERPHTPNYGSAESLRSFWLAWLPTYLRIEAHLREFIPAGPRAPEGDGYLAALINFRFLAQALLTTNQAVSERTN
jgi:biuret amidohydrolase